MEGWSVAHPSYIRDDSKNPFFAFIHKEVDKFYKIYNKDKFYNKLIFFSVWVFFHDHSQITGLQEKGKGISLTHHYLFQSLHRHLGIIRAITAESSPPHIGSNRTRTFGFRA